MSLNQDKTKNLGELAITGGPGRPPGSRPRFAILKDELANEQNQQIVLGIWKEMLEGNKTDRREALKLAFQLLPREDKIQHEIASLVLNKVVHQTYELDAITCPKCSHAIDLHAYTQDMHSPHQPEQAQPDAS